MLHVEEHVQQTHLLPMLFISYSIYNRVFFSRSLLMVVTLETNVQRELQTATSVFNRFRVDLGNIRLRIQQLPELLLQQGFHCFRKRGKFMPKNPRVYMALKDCIYFLCGIPHTRNHPLHTEFEYKNSCETPYIYIIIHIYGIFTLQMIPTIISSCESRHKVEAP